MRLPSIADRLGERFVRPLASIGLGPGAAGDGTIARRGGRRGFARLEAGHCPVHPGVSGAGFDLPAWLEALQREVERAVSQSHSDEDVPGPELPIGQVQLTREEARRQVRAIYGK